MQYVSTAYKEAMKQPARNKSYMRVSLGLINQAAQSAAEIQNEKFTYFSNLVKPLSNESVNKIYATFERNFSKLDRSMYFLPRNRVDKTYYNAGLVTEALCGLGEQPVVEILFHTPDPMDIKGLTLEFGETYPTKFAVETDEDVFEYENTSSNFKTEDTFNNTTFMRIRAKEMVNGIGRFRIYNIVFGIGLTFDNEKIVSADLKSSISPISEFLPSVDFDLTIENVDRYYNVDNDDSAINYMETGQKMEVYYGYTLNDGNVEWVKGATLYMKEWSANDKQAKFGAVDVFEYMQEEYTRGRYYPEGITLYDLALDVFQDAKISSDAYWIDPYLKKVQVNRTQYFMPRGKKFLHVGYVSRSISDEYGYFDENPIITLNMESAYTFYNLALIFGSIQPVEFVITTYNNGKKIKSFASKSIVEKTIVYYDFIDADKITLEFTKAKPYNRIHLKQILFGNATDYQITYDDLTATPNGIKLEKIKELRVIRTIYTKGTEKKDLTSEEIILIPGQEAEYEINFESAVHDLSVVCLENDIEKDYGAVILESSSYHCKIRITKLPVVETKIIITVKGYEYNITTSVETAKLNNAGSIQVWNNPLISSYKEAKDLVEWVGNFYRSGNQYELRYRGDPILDCNDLAYLENKYVSDLLVRLEEIGLNFAGGLSGTLVARREK